MSVRDGKMEYDDLLMDASQSLEDDYSLEEILAEYGTSREQKVLREVEREVEPVQKPAKKELPVQIPEPRQPTPEELPRQPQPITLEDVVGSTVDAVMADNVQLLRPNRSLFSRRKVEETDPNSNAC